LIGLLTLCALPAQAQHPSVSEDAGVRQTIAAWNAAYRAMNAKTLAALFTPEVEIIDRFGHWVKAESTEQVENLWQQTFTTIYQGKPGPERKVERVRMLSSDVALVQATTRWDAVTLPDGRVIPSHGEIDTFVLVKQNGAWRITALNIHNQMAPGSERAGEKIPVPPEKPNPQE
jgi:uncharacterized protein (TIGR02246 family)